MQPRLVEWSAKDRVIAVFERDPQTSEPFGPLGSQPAFEPNLVDGRSAGRGTSLELTGHGPSIERPVGDVIPPKGYSQGYSQPLGAAGSGPAAALL